MSGGAPASRREGWLLLQGFVEDAVVLQGAARGLLGEEDCGDSDHGQDREVDADGQGVFFLNGAQQGHGDKGRQPPANTEAS